MFFGDGGFWALSGCPITVRHNSRGRHGNDADPVRILLSDDIINAVPQSLRDGSTAGCHAIRNNSQRNFARGPSGIIGAILLATSRAIGETMIVVMGAGAVAKFAGNPLEALTTITTRIVSQLTGDLEFDSPETLVAFALGLTLFVLTLCLNVLALYIVRKYREQYE